MYLRIILHYKIIAEVGYRGKDTTNSKYTLQGVPEQMSMRHFFLGHLVLLFSIVACQALWLLRFCKRTNFSPVLALNVSYSFKVCQGYVCPACSTVTLLKIRYDTRYFVPEKKFRGRERGIKFLKKVERNGSRNQISKKSGNEGNIFALIEHYFSKSMKKS